MRACAFDGSVTKPCWFWAERKFDLEAFLTQMAKDSDPFRRHTAIDWATVLRISFLKQNEEFIQQLLTDQDSGVRRAAFLHFAALGRTKAISILRRLAVNTDAELRAEVYQTRQ